MLPTTRPEHDTLQTQTHRSSTPFTASSRAHDQKTHLLLAASGSVATIKIPLILSSLSHHPTLSIILILTHSASSFLSGQSAEQPHYKSLSQIPNVDGIFLDDEEWVLPWKRGDSILHIELRRWADCMVVAPLSANTLAKVVGGLADNLLSCVVRAWDTTGLVEPSTAVAVSGDGVGNEGEKRRKKKRIIVAPAMNTAMWRHPITTRQIRVLEEEWGVEGDGERDGWFEVLRPMEKELACGDVGDGAMKDWKEIVKVIEQRLEL
ncbi:hypothetical protein WAI453_005746 [Rhynchosporium graminicola]|uniref:Probable protein SIS2 n=1 Tax=Rhynchosporium graminicola TaxID=2792576 RepID=A0A1E1KKH4_9HELO|nr:probable protein SIS2 [Rhynchosporium commune]